MSVNTTNAYGQITISNDAIAEVAGSSALECYGIIDIHSKGGAMTGGVSELLNKKKLSRWVKVQTKGDRIYIDLYVAMKYGVSIEAVSQTLRKTVKYDVEKFTGMLVDTVNVNVTGVRV